MKFLIDMALSPLLSQLLREAGHDSVHVRDYDMEAAKDDAIFERAASEERTIVSADTDFAHFLPSEIQQSLRSFYFAIHPCDRLKSKQVSY